MQKNADMDKEDLKEMQESIKALYRRHGSDAKLLFFLAGALGEDLNSLSDLWDASKRTYNDALSSEGVFRG